MTNAILFLAAMLGAVVAVMAWFAALYLTRTIRAKNPRDTTDEAAARRIVDRLAAIERLKLILLAILALIVIGLSVVINDVSNKLNDVGDVKRSQQCIVELLRTPNPPNITDEALKARHCPSPAPFSSGP